MARRPRAQTETAAAPPSPPSPPRQLGKYERLCHERHARDLELARAPGGHPRGLWFDLAAGDRVVQFVEGFCKHHKGEWAGKPMLLEEWQKAIIRQAFGWKRRDGSRRYRSLYWEMPRKQGKSQIAAALGLYLLVADGEPGAEIYSSATKRDQAKIVWDTATAMVKASTALKKYVTPFRSNLFVEKTGGKFEPLSADAGTLDGLNPHGNIVDELHAHKDRGVWDVLDTAMGARRQPLTIAITTAGTYAAESIGWQLHDYACKVLDGVIQDDAIHAFIVAADEGDDYFSEAAQQKANPNWGISVKPDYLREQAKKALEQPSFTNEYLRLHLNVWTQQITRWLSVEKWAECEPELKAARDVRAIALERERQLAGRACFGGLDLSTKLDLSALVLAFPAPDSDVVDLLCRFYMPEATVADRAARGKKHYEQWVREGWITATPGETVDYEFIRRDVNALAKLYKLQDLAFDPWGATDLANRLMGDGIKLVECRQGFKTLSEPSKDFEARIVSKKVRHAGNPVLRFCVSNAVVTRDPAGNIKPDKEKASDKIDGVVAAIMALSRVISVKQTQASYLASQELVILG